MPTTTTTPDFFRMSGAKLRWHVQRGPIVLRPQAQAELDRRAAKHAPKPAKVARPQAPAKSVTRMGSIVDDWNALSGAEARALWAEMNSADTYALTH